MLLDIHSYRFAATLLLNDSVNEIKTKKTKTSLNNFPSKQNRFDYELSTDSLAKYFFSRYNNIQYLTNYKVRRSDDFKDFYLCKYWPGLYLTVKLRAQIYLHCNIFCTYAGIIFMEKKFWFATDLNNEFILLVYNLGERYCII